MYVKDGIKIYIHSNVPKEEKGFKISLTKLLFIRKLYIDKLNDARDNMAQ